MNQIIAILCYFSLLITLSSAAFPQENLSTKCLSLEQSQEIDQKVSRVATQFDTKSMMLEFSELWPKINAALDRYHQCQSNRSLLDNCSKEADEYNMLVTRHNALEGHIKLFNETIMTQIQVIRAGYPPCL